MPHDGRHSRGRCRAGRLCVPTAIMLRAAHANNIVFSSNATTYQRLRLTLHTNIVFLLRGASTVSLSCCHGWGSCIVAALCAGNGVRAGRLTYCACTRLSRVVQASTKWQVWHLVWVAHDLLQANTPLPLRAHGAREQGPGCRARLSCPRKRVPSTALT